MTVSLINIIHYYEMTLTLGPQSIIYPMLFIMCGSVPLFKMLDRACGITGVLITIRYFDT